jgi:hypothetical protein
LLSFAVNPPPDLQVKWAMSTNGQEIPRLKSSHAAEARENVGIEKPLNLIDLFKVRTGPGKLLGKNPAEVVPLALSTTKRLLDADRKPLNLFGHTELLSGISSDDSFPKQLRLSADRTALPQVTINDSGKDAH